MSEPIDYYVITSGFAGWRHQTHAQEGYARGEEHKMSTMDLFEGTASLCSKITMTSKIQHRIIDCNSTDCSRQHLTQYRLNVQYSISLLTIIITSIHRVICLGVTKCDSPCVWHWAHCDGGAICPPDRGCECHCHFNQDASDDHDHQSQCLVTLHLKQFNLKLDSPTMAGLWLVSTLLG